MPPLMIDMQHMRRRRSRSCLGPVHTFCGDSWRACAGHRSLQSNYRSGTLRDDRSISAKPQEGQRFRHQLSMPTPVANLDQRAVRHSPMERPQHQYPQETAALQEIARSCGLIEKIKWGNLADEPLTIEAAGIVPMLGCSETVSGSRFAIA